jgi:flagellum-specific peptidoglycan hydrolase FlgJ
MHLRTRMPVHALLLVVLAVLGCSSSERALIETQVALAGETAVALAKDAGPPLQTEAAKAAHTLLAEVSDLAGTQSSHAEETLAAGLATELAGASPTLRPDFTVDSDLTEVAMVSGPQLDAAIKATRSDSPLVGLGQTFVDVGTEEGINAFYIAAHAAHESSWGTSRLAEMKNNIFGYGAYNSCPFECARSFTTKAECVVYVMHIVKGEYLTEGGRYYNGQTLKGMNINYATDPNWKNSIVTIMNKLLARVQSQ